MRVKVIDSKKGAKPRIPLTVRRVEHTVFADLGFAKEHYLTASINPSCKCLLFEWGEVPVAFCAVIARPTNGRPYAMAISRLVVLPAYQGLGLSRVISDFAGGIVGAEGEEYRLYIKTAHELMGSMFDNNSNWEGTSFDGKGRKGEESDIYKKFLTQKFRNTLTRKSYCKGYKGKHIEGYGELLRPVEDLRMDKYRNDERALFRLFGYGV